MTWKTLLLCLLTGALFTSCLEEDSGLAGMMTVDDFANQEEVLAGTGLPKTAFLETVTYTGKESESRTESLGHVEMRFRNCADEWCKALVDDCGISSGVDFSYTDDGGAKKMGFDAYSTSPAVSQWAVPNRAFDFERDGANLTLSCFDCPGTTSDGFEFTDRKVTLRVVR
ncbi:hypothetical protein [Neolewinella agarilytica]|uniref:hypothetical protein n=1 Tax=Neolewinella agarilytica TaxID=478744 RepID=UPI002354620E|nr:hypothetical protein [Neolewinella agarilytica]